jgi:hypothetical protein
MSFPALLGFVMLGFVTSGIPERESKQELYHGLQKVRIICMYN